MQVCKFASGSHELMEIEMDTVYSQNLIFYYVLHCLHILQDPQQIITVNENMSSSTLKTYHDLNPCSKRFTSDRVYVRFYSRLRIVTGP